MQNLYNHTDAAQCRTELELRAYTSRLLGARDDLVLAGGGNTSVKLETTDVFGGSVQTLWVKGSGGALKTITPAGFAPVRVDHLLRLSMLERLSDTEMMRQYRLALLDPDAPFPSVEAILHAILPAKWVDHTHADALETIMNTPSGDDRVRELYGKAVVYVPYVMPGFDLALACKRCYMDQASDTTVGMVLQHHGLFTWGNTARESYERMIELVTRAEAYLETRGAWSLTPAALESSPNPTPLGLSSNPMPLGLSSNPMPLGLSSNPMALDIAQLRHDISGVAGRPMIVSKLEDALCTVFSRRDNLAALATRGPATVDHVSWTRHQPLIGRDVSAYAHAYRAYFNRHAPTARAALTMVDPAPRVVIDATLGVLTAGRTVQDTQMTGAIYRQTVQMMERAERLERWQVLPEEKFFEIEYWELQQAKFKKGPALPEFAGEVALVTGAASGIGRACVESFLARGAAVVGLDLDQGVETNFVSPDYLGITCDVTDEHAIRNALEQTVRRFGGLDMIVLNAGIFPSSTTIASLDLTTWQKVMRVNLDANLSLMRETHAFLKRAPKGGRVVVIASKNVPAPGPGAAAYSASKAALTQLARVAALEWGADNIRVNILHPNAVFDTGIWTPEVLEKRAASYKLSVNEYKRNNVLKTEVSSHNVAELAAVMCGAAFEKTTGAQVPVDGGNDRVI
jgi:rhamnose utilization protein RhaD (predicted bifunctional aldolase and dehydrogenase)/NAD(P)-dependent dehydrogenase (short-subunit alcohol dehydrogenase family)